MPGPSDPLTERDVPPVTIVEAEHTEPSISLRLLDLAILIPCKDEARTVAKVVEDFRREFPTARIYVYDNCSSDDTAERAAAAGAIVRRESRPGKGFVIRRMLADIDADAYVMVDGDDTYDAAAASRMVAMLVEQQLDMVVGVRESDVPEAAYRRGHEWGNRLFTGMHERMFGKGFSDVFSGYRVLSRRFAKSFPASARGFEIEAELSAHALDIGAPVGELVTAYSERPHGSESKLRTYRDGVRILLRSVLYFKEKHPARFFGIFFVLLSIVALVLAFPVVTHYVETREVPRLPTALLAAAIQITAFISLTCGIILDSVARARRETKRLHYLALPALRVDQGR